MLERFIKFQWIRSLSALIVCCLALTGCGSSSVNKGNYERIKSGMTEGDVDRILGKGKDLRADEVEQVIKRLTPSTAPKTETDGGGMKGMRWGTEKRSITVIYRDGRVYKVEPQGL